jgi:tripartite-type tricarboxylate transporter receptor subunit TctC
MMPGGKAMRRVLHAVAVLLIAGLGLLWTSASRAQGWPPNPIRFIVPFPPGGTTDQIARRVQPLLQAELKTTIIIENRSGAAGAIGTQAAATAPPDGATFLLVFDSHVVNPSILPNLPFDTRKDLAPIMLIGTSPMVITAHPASEYKSLADVIAAARKKEGALGYGTIGAGSLAHLTMSQIGNELKVTMTNIPYKGGGPLASDAVAGHVQVAIASVANMSPHIMAGALRPLAVTSAKRFAQLPDTPTLKELDIPVEAEAWWGMLAPAKTPADIIARMNAAMRKALQEPIVQLSLSEQGVIYRVSTPEAFGDFIDSEITRWAKVVKDNKIAAAD